MVNSTTRDIGGNQPNRGNRRVSYRQLLKGYHAIIFTVQDYPDPAIPNLRTPANDGRNLADLLVSHCGFPADNVVLCRESDVTWDRLDDRLRGFISNLSHDDSLLIYFAGHGEADSATRESYWLPHDAQKDNRRTWYSHDRLHRTIAEIKARHIAVVSDSCFSGRLLRSASEIKNDSDEVWIKDAVQSRSRMALTSGGDHPASDEGAAGLSIFNLNLTEVIRTSERRVFTLGQVAYSIQSMIPNQRVCYGPLPDIAHKNGEFVLFRTDEPGVSTEKEPEDSEVKSSFSKLTPESYSGRDSRLTVLQSRTKNVLFGSYFLFATLFLFLAYICFCVIFSFVVVL